MNRTIIHSVLAFAGAATLVMTASLLLITPDVAEARPPCGEPYNCQCGPEMQTPMVWGMGVDCAAAFQDAISQAQNLFQCEGDTCSETFVVTTACWPTGGGWQVDGYMLYKCKDCMVDPCEPWII